MSGRVALERPALRYHGGKWMLAPWLVSQMPPHRVYVEPFGGGGSVLLRKPRSYAEVYNDLWGDVVNVFRVLRDPTSAEMLKRALELTPFARVEFVDTKHTPEDDAVERARKTIFRSFAGFGSAATNGDFATGFRANSNRSGTTPAHDWRNYPDNIAALVERLRGVVIENKPATDLIPQHDGAETLFYVDPPYPHATRTMNRGNASYAHEMTDADHADLARCLHGVAGMVMLSTYPCPLYDDLYADWTFVDREALADGARERTERLYFNPAACAAIARSKTAGPLFAEVHP